MALLRRRVRCHYCGQQARESVSQVPQQYLCPHCDALNHFDQHGNIEDPPAETVGFPLSTSTSFLYAHAPSRSPSPAMSFQTEDFFCNTCQHNQMLMHHLLAEYLPDDDDPEYDQRAANYEEYRADIEARLPQVCGDCEPRVQAQLRATGYAAKADDLRRKMAKSHHKRQAVLTSRETWFLRTITLAKWVYIFSVAAETLWHIAGSMMVADESMAHDAWFSWSACLHQAALVQEMDRGCVESSLVLGLIKTALAADLLTIWWNPKLRARCTNITGRLRGLASFSALRIASLALRIGFFVYSTHTSPDEFMALTPHTAHIILLTTLLASFTASWRLVSITHHPPPPTAAPQLTPTKTKIRKHRNPAPSSPTAYDTMASAFTSSFASSDPAPAVPPSPTLTVTSTRTYTTTTDADPFDAATPRTALRHRTQSRDEDADTMDWTPTTRRFAPHAPALSPSPWPVHQPPNAQPPPPQQSAQRHSPRSLFSRPDPNPFRHRVPAAPANPAKERVDPWRQGVWDPPLRETRMNFFAEDQRVRDAEGDAVGQGGAVQGAGAERGERGGGGGGLQGIGVPRNVARDAELFREGRFKYGFFGEMRESGLEEGVGGLGM